MFFWLETARLFNGREWDKKNKGMAAAYASAFIDLEKGSVFSGTKKYYSSYLEYIEYLATN